MRDVLYEYSRFLYKPFAKAGTDCIQMSGLPINGHHHQTLNPSFEVSFDGNGVPQYKITRLGDYVGSTPALVQGLMHTLTLVQVQHEAFVTQWDRGRRFARDADDMASILWKYWWKDATACENILRDFLNEREHDRACDEAESAQADDSTEEE